MTDRRSDSYYLDQLFNKLDVGLLEAELLAMGVERRQAEGIVTGGSQSMRAVVASAGFDLALIHANVVRRAHAQAQRRAAAAAAAERKPKQRKHTRSSKDTD